MTFPHHFFGVFGEGYLILVALGSLLLHVFLAMGVYKEASERAIRGHKLWFIDPGSGRWAH